MKLRRGHDGGMDVGRLPGELAVDSADDDPGMIGPRMVQADEVFSVQCHYGAIVGDGELQHFFVGCPLFGFARVLDCNDIVAKILQLFTTGSGKFSLAYSFATCYASSLSRICCSISALCTRTYAQASAKSSTRRSG